MAFCGTFLKPNHSLLPCYKHKAPSQNHGCTKQFCVRASAGGSNDGDRTIIRKEKDGWKINYSGQKPATPLLDTINYPVHMNNLSIQDLEQLAAELRADIVHSVSNSGGHLSSSLGVVELSVALHHVFNTPEDKIIWDVGHQAYPHKILTGRRSKMHTIRKTSGLAGFPKRDESPHDAFGAGHSSTSISAGLGMAVARDLIGKNNSVISVIGDGAMTAGQAYEAMNNAGFLDANLIVILNDNKQVSLPTATLDGPATPVGALSSALSKIQASTQFRKLREAAKSITKQIGGQTHQVADAYAKNKGMSNLQIQTEQPPPAQVPLLTSNSNQNHQTQQDHENVSSDTNNNNNNEDETELDRTLARLETFLTLLGFNQRSLLTFALSWTVFAVVGVALPLVALRFSECSSSFHCDRFEIKSFEIDIVAFQAFLAAVSLLCLSHNLRKYGLRRFLFVDRDSGNQPCFHHDYVKQISGSFRLLILWVLPCFLLKTVREIVRISYVQLGSWWLSPAIILALIISWTYVSAITLSASILFHLVCNLQVIHFDDYGKLLQRESDVLVFMEEHIRLRYHLSKISHRFRIYLLLGFLVVTSSQCVTLLQVTGYSGVLTFINGGDFAVATLVQVVGIIICLHAATRISHRAQGVVSLASRWHALVTCTSDASQLRSSASSGSLEAANHINSIHLDYSESDLESMDYAGSGMPSNTQLASYMSSHHKRQAFVMYLQTNPGGITIFGWTVDRSFVNTIFFLELSLVTFVLSKTII